MHVLNSVVQMTSKQVTNSVQRPFNYRFTLFKLMDIQLDRAAR